MDRSVAHIVYLNDGNRAANSEQLTRRHSRTLGQASGMLLAPVFERWAFEHSASANITGPAPVIDRSEPSFLVVTV